MRLLMPAALHRTGPFATILVPHPCPVPRTAALGGRVMIAKLLRHTSTLLFCILAGCLFVWINSLLPAGVFLRGALSGHSSPIQYHQHIVIPQKPAKSTGVDSPEERGEPGDSLSYLFVDVYSEQIGRSVNNFARLLTYSRKLRRRLVQPFVHGSRLSGMHRKDIKTPQDFSYYFDLDALHALLNRRRFPPLVTMKQLIADCSYGWDVVLLLQHEDHALSRPVAGSVRNLKEDVDKCRKAAEESETGQLECPVLPQVARLLPEQRLKRKAEPKLFKRKQESARGVVINTARFHDLQKLGELLGSAKCAMLMEWAGEGEKRASFKGLTAEEEQHQIRPYEILHSSRLVNKAREFARKHLGQNYLAIHLRAEKLAKFGSKMDEIKKCLDTVADLVKKLKQENDYGNSKTFLATDLSHHGSDTIGKHISQEDRESLQQYAEKLFENVVTPSDFELHDHGARAIIEMQVAGQAAELIAVGGGNFQAWMSVLFRKARNRPEHRACMQTKVPSGWEYTEPNE